MSTRACIKIKAGLFVHDEDTTPTECIITLYHHMDGYPGGVGSDLKDYLETQWNVCPQWNAERIATDLVRGAIKDDDGNADMGYEVAICEHGDCEYGYIIDCETKTLKCYELDAGVQPWKRVVTIPDKVKEEPVPTGKAKPKNHQFNLTLNKTKTFGLSTKKLAEQVSVTCYNKTETTTRQKALNKYYEGMRCCEGSERERYETIFFQLMDGEMEASDEESC